MALHCSSLFIKYLLFFFNLLFVITGIVITSVGITVKAYYHEYQTFLDNRFIYASDLLIIIGVIIFIVAFFGCCGAVKENACMTLTFSSLLIVIFALELIVGIGGFLLKNKTNEVLENVMRDSMDKYNNTNETEVTDMWDGIQQEFKCCGVDSPYDWMNKTNSTNHLIPMSCCKHINGAIGTVTCNINSTSLYKEGCLTIFGDYIKENAVTIEGVGLGLAVLQLIGILLSCYLSRQIRRDYETV